MHRVRAAQMEFHVSREARDRYEFDQALFSLTGNVLFANFYAARVFAQKMNDRRDLVHYPERAVRAGHINAMGLVDEILHYVVQLYREEKNAEVMGDALDWLYEELGRETVDDTLRRFADQFPPVAVYRREVSLDDYIEGETAGIPHRRVLLEEMLLLWLANTNPAFAPFLELFDDDDLSRETAYPQIVDALHDFFEEQPRFGPDDENVVDMLRSPAENVPHSLSGQLEFIRERWGSFLGKYLYRLLSSLDLIAEEEKAIFLGRGPSRVPEYGALAFEAERFSQDKDWMPRVVVVAKNTYVWLDQLSKRYERDIRRLDQIPDEELDRLARWGFTGLWLIGLWERSSASRKIKQLCGNPEAVASAYSLYDYVIAGDLGGPAAYENLRDRAWQRGIRLASDMVPNHVGIYSKWVIEHPDWFVALDHSPFPVYSFGGPDLSEDPRVGLFIEDHYYDRTDAAVVFRRLDRWSGDERFIYHGNDGTSMPWNDTAQLNFLLPEVREAVIQTILHVARHFSIIRFDAAMTLAKKHYRRLWFPEPGSGGAIPTRAEHGLTKEEFDAAMPVEFWREVVDRVAAEAPDTLLLAEAFWLLEGYFVRTLGMHRVYNSAFMNMLRDEDNAKYRSVMKNTLEFDPEILKRFVNFMNNPDEETAVAQFGKGDKYFGICTLMATMPGLPMFGHGQVEGLAEKYGMEYRRAYWDEEPDPGLVARHEREIFPLLHRRYLFAQVRDFLLYDFFAPEGHVNEDVFAYSNRAGDPHAGTGQRVLVIYHNKYATARGWVKTSVAYSAKTGDDGDGSTRRDAHVTTGRALTQKNLGEGLDLRGDDGVFYVFRDSLTGLEYIRAGRELRDNGFYVELEAYECHVFLDWREVQDNEWRQYAHLADYLGGRGVPSIEEALKEVFLQPIHEPFRELVNAGHLRWLVDNRAAEPDEAPDAEVLDDAERRALALLREMRQFTGGSGDPEAIAGEIRRKLDLALRTDEDDDPAYWGTLLGWTFTHALGKVVADEDYPAQSRSWLDEWLLGKLLAGALQDLGLDEGGAWWAVGAIKVLVSHQDWCDVEAAPEAAAYPVLRRWLGDSEVQQFLQVNRYRDELWFNHEAFGQLLDWLETIAAIDIGADPSLTEAESETRLAACRDIVDRLRAAEEASEYQVSKLLEAARE